MESSEQSLPESSNNEGVRKAIGCDGGECGCKSTEKDTVIERLKEDVVIQVDRIKTLEEESEQQTENLKLLEEGIDYTVQFKPLDVHGLPSVMSTLNDAFQELFNHLTSDMPPHDQVRLIMNSHQLDRPISLPFLRRDQLTPERFLAAVERVVQSNDEFTLNEPVNVNVVHVAMPQGGRGRKRNVVNLQSYLDKKRCVIQIKNKDELCCARAIVVAKAKLDGDPQYRSVADYRKPLQRRLAHDLHDSADVPLGPCGIPEIKKFQTVLPEYQINVVSKDHLNAMIYSGPPAEKHLYLYHHDGHYDVITSMPAFLARAKYCHKCKKGYDHITDHPCGDLCKLCNTQSCQDVRWKPCGDCNRFFKSDACYDRHKVGLGDARSLCQSLIKCKTCQRVVTRTRINDHHCGKVRCFVCSKYVEPENHRCYLQPVVARETDDQQGNELLDDDVAVENDVADGQSLMFFDFECTQDDGRHVPNLCVVQNEAGDETVFSGPNTQEDFCQWLFQPTNANTTFIAHNFQAYDGYFILQHLYKQGITPELIVRGAKILSLTVKELKIKFIDSLCFIPMRLAAFPKTFGLNELEKGYFPHLFNRAENQSYVGPMPAVELYDPDGMSPADREKFLAWYNHPERQNHIFNFEVEILRYCQSDVDILRRCCLEFRELFQQTTDVDPFASCLTIASACNLVFRKTFLQEDTIAVIPPSGYKPEHKQSVVALKMLAWLAERDDTAIQHARNHGEKRIGKYLVDGFNEETNTIWEVQGCLFHGCERCYSPDTINPVNKLSMHDLRQRTLEKVQFLQDQGFNVVEIWTCDIERQLAADPEMKEFFDNLEISEPLEPRQGFFGGRTNATRLFHHVEEGEKVRYADFCSLYPYCNKYGEYPLGHPDIITENFRPIDQYFGLVKCSVLPPRGLYHPVLPHRTQGKLMFPLCRTCADTLQQEPCNHSDSERTLHGTWVSLELQKALEKGYELVKIEEVWHFEEHTDSLFKDYIDTFLKIKQEASGYPTECTTEEAKAQYIADYAAHEGIQLDPRQIVKNPGLRALSKLMLNSFWENNNLEDEVFALKEELKFGITQHEVLAMLEGQVSQLHEEKGKLNDKLCEFENDTVELSNLFRLQQEKIGHDLANKDQVINVLENERKLMEKDGKNVRDELEKARRNIDSMKKHLEQVKLSAQEKDAAILNLSDLHEETVKQRDKLQEDLASAEEKLKSETMSRRNVEEQLQRISNENISQSEEILELKKSISEVNIDNTNLKSASEEVKGKLVEVETLVGKLKRAKEEIEKESLELKGRNRNLLQESESARCMLGETKKILEQQTVRMKGMETQNLQLVERREELKREVEMAQLDTEQLHQKIVQQEDELENLRQNLETTKEIAEQKTLDLNRSVEEESCLKEVIEKLNMNEKMQKETLEQVKEDLELTISAKENVDYNCNEMREHSRCLNEKISALSSDVENLENSCEMKSKENNQLLNELNQRNLSVTTHLALEEKLQLDIEDLQVKETRLGIELKNAREEIGKLVRENKMMDEHFGKVNMQLQECLGLLDEKRQEYLVGRKRLEEQIRKQQEETSLFRDHNSEINRNLKERENEIVSLTMEKLEVVRSMENVKNELQILSSKNGFLKDELNELKDSLQEYSEKEHQMLEEKGEIEKKLSKVKGILEMEEEEKKDIESSLGLAREDVERWKKISLEYKEERNRLQKQIEDLDKNLNEKSLYFTEEKSTLERNLESLRNVVKRLKSNEEILRNKIEDLRSEVDRLLDIRAEQQAQIRNLKYDKDKLETAMVDYKKVVEERDELLKQTYGLKEENIKFKKKIESLEAKCRACEDQDEQRMEEIKELRVLVESTQESFQESTRKCEGMRTESIGLRESNLELLDEKQRLSNETCRLKERKSAILEERNKLQDMIESLDKCHREKNDNLTGKNALLEKELGTSREMVGTLEMKEDCLQKEIQKINQTLEDALKENQTIQGTLKKVEGENLRLRRRVSEFGQLVDEKEAGCNENIRLTLTLQEGEHKIKKLEGKERVLSILISKMNQQQTENSSKLRQLEIENCELKSRMEIESNEKESFKEINTTLEEDLRNVKTKHLGLSNELRDEKKEHGQKALLLSKLEKEKCELKDLLELNIENHERKITELNKEREKDSEKIDVLQNDRSKEKQTNVDLNQRIHLFQEENEMLTSKNVEFESNLKERMENIIELNNAAETLSNENQGLREHAENVEKIFATKNTEMSVHTSGMEKEIRILRDTLAQLRSSSEINRKEMDELRRKLEKEKNAKYDAELQLNEMRLKRERLEGKHDELMNDCKELQELVEKSEHVNVLKEECEKLLGLEKTNNRNLEGELHKKNRDISLLKSENESLLSEVSNYKNAIDELKNIRGDLQKDNDKLIEESNKALQDFNSVKEKFQVISSEKLHLSELVLFHKEETENLRNEVDACKAKHPQQIHDLENEKSLLGNNVKIKEETLEKLTGKLEKLQHDLKKAKEENDDLENENEDILMELDQSKEHYKQVRESFFILQRDHGELEDKLKEKENKWCAETEKSSLEMFEMGTKLTTYVERLENAQQRIEKQRELEKVLRQEIEELSDSYVKLEEEVHHCNKENISLKENVQDLLQSIEELELARETACLLKEKRQNELLKTEKNVQRLEKILKEKEKENKNLNKDLDGIMENQKLLELKLQNEKDMSSQRIKQVEDLQYIQRKLEEEVWQHRQNKERLDTEIETWQLNGNSMKLRIETLAEELENLSSEKEDLRLVYEECRSEKHVLEERIDKVKEDQENENVLHGNKIGNMLKEHEEITKVVTELHAKLNEQKTKASTMKDLYENLNNTYQSSCVLVQDLKNTISEKEWRIAELQKRKDEMVNLLSDLDAKIAKIQEQAGNLEEENNSLRSKLTEALSMEEHWKATVENQCTVFSEKFETESREKQQLDEMKEHFVELCQNRENEIQEVRTELKKLLYERDRLNSENIVINRAKRDLEEQLLEKTTYIQRLQHDLMVERNKTIKLEAENTNQLDDLNSVKGEHGRKLIEMEKAKSELKEAKNAFKTLEERMEDKSFELAKNEEILKNIQEKSKEYQESLTEAIVDHKEVLNDRDAIIETMRKEKHELSNIVDSMNARLEQVEQEKTRYRDELKSLQKIIEEKQEVLNSLRASNKSIVNTNEYLKDDLGKAIEKTKILSKDFAELEFEHQRVLTDNEKVVTAYEERENETNEKLKHLTMERRCLQESIENQEQMFENLKAENDGLLRQTENLCGRLQEEIEKFDDVQETVVLQKKENDKLKDDIKKAIRESEYFENVNKTVTECLSKLRNETASPKANKEDHKLQAALDREAEFSPKIQQASELEIRFAEIETEVRSLRDTITTKEEDYEHIMSLLKTTKEERDKLDIELAKQAKRCEYEVQARERVDAYLMKIKSEFGQLKDGTEQSVNKWREENLNLTKKTVELQEEISFFRNTNASMFMQNEELERILKDTQIDIKMMEEDIHGKTSTIDLLKEQVSQLNNVNHQMKEENLRSQEQLREKEQEIIKMSQELKDLQNLWTVNSKLLRKLETGNLLHKKTESDGEEHAPVSVNAQENITDNKTYENVPLHKIKAVETSTGQLQDRFEQLFARNAEQIERTRVLETELAGTQTQLNACSKGLQDCVSEKQCLETERMQLRKQLLAAKAGQKEAIAQTEELTQTLTQIKAKFEESKVVNEEESMRISQEVNQMQIELVEACDKFNKENVKSKVQDETIELNQRRIHELENNLHKSRQSERSLTLRKTELETKSEILGKTNNSLENEVRTLQNHVRDLQIVLRSEKDSREKTTAEKEAFIAELQIKLEDSEKQLSIIQQRQNETNATLKEREDDYLNLTTQFQTKSQDYDRLKETSSKLKKYIQKLETDLDQNESRLSQTQGEMVHLEQDLDAIKEKETQQQYQYKLLEREKESLEHEVNCSGEIVVKLTHKLDETLSTLSLPDSEGKRLLLNDSGIGIDSSFLGASTVREPLDNDVFVQLCEQDKKDEVAEIGFLAEYLRSLESVVDKTTSVMSVFNKNYQEKSRLFQEKETSLFQEVNVLQRTVSHNNYTRIELEKEIQRLDDSKKCLEETLEQKSKDQSALLDEVSHLTLLKAEKEKCVEMLNVSVQSCKNRQELLENKLLARQDELVREKSERSNVEESKLAQEKTFEELRQSYLKNDIENQRKLEIMDTRINSLEEELRDKQNMTSVLRNDCASYEEKMNRLQNEFEKSLLTIENLNNSLKESEDNREKAGNEIINLMKHLECAEEAICHLKTSNKDLKETNNSINNELNTSRFEQKRITSELLGAKENITKMTLENMSQEKRVNDLKHSLEEKDNENSNIFIKQSNTENALIKSEDKVRTIGGFLEQIKTCKEQLEQEIDVSKKENEELKMVQQSLEVKVKDLNLKLTNSNKECERLEKINFNQENDLNTANHLLQRTTEELDTSLVQAKSINNTAESVNHIMDQWFSKRTAASTDDNILLGKDTDENNISISEDESLTRQLHLLKAAVDSIFEKCHENVLKQQNLVDELSQKTFLLEVADEERSKLRAKQEQLNTFVNETTEKCIKLGRSCRIHEEDAEQLREELLAKAKSTTELRKVNASQQEHIKELEIGLSTTKNMVESLEIEHGELKVEILAKRNEVRELESKCEHMEILEQELKTNRLSLDVMRDEKTKMSMEKDDIRLELDHLEKRMHDVEDEIAEDKQRLYKSQNTLKVERERFETLTNVAMIKDNKLEEGRKTINEKGERIRKLEKELLESNTHAEASRKELSNQNKRLEIVLDSKKVLASRVEALEERVLKQKKNSEDLISEKDTLAEDNKKKKSKISVLVDSYRRQEQDNKELAEKVQNLKEEVSVCRSKMHGLKSEHKERLEQIDEMEDKYRMERSGFLEKCVASSAKVSNLEKSLLYLNDDLSRSNEQNSELKKKYAECKAKLSGSMDRNVELEAKGKLHENAAVNSEKHTQHLSKEIRSLQKRLNDVTNENIDLRRKLEINERHLMQVSSDLTSKELENASLTESVEARSEVLRDLGTVIVTSMKEIQELYNDDSSADLGHYTTTKQVQNVCTDTGKFSKDDLNTFNQSLQKELRDAVDQFKSVVEELSIDIRTLQGTSVKNPDEIAEQGVLDEKLGINGLQSNRQASVGRHSTLASVKHVIQQLKEDVKGCNENVRGIWKKCSSLEQEIVLIDQVNAEKKKPIKLPTSPAECPINKQSKSGSDVRLLVRNVGQLDSYLGEIDTAVKQILSEYKKVMKQSEVLETEHQLLLANINDRESSITNLQVGNDLLQMKCDQHESREAELASSIKEVKIDRDKLIERLEELKNASIQEQEKISEMFNELCGLNKEKHGFTESITELEVELKDGVTMFTELMSTHKELKSSQQELESDYQNMCNKSKELEAEISAQSDKVASLESKLKDSCELSQRLQKQCLDEREVVDTLKLQIEIQTDEARSLKKHLECSTSETENLEKRIHNLNEEIQLSNETIQRQNVEVSNLEAKLIEKDDYLEQCKAQVQHLKDINEAVSTSKEISERKLEDTESCLKKCEKLLNEEKILGRRLRTEKEELLLENDSCSSQFREDISKLMSRLSKTKAEEMEAMHELTSKKEKIAELEHELSAQHKKRTEVEENSKTTLEELHSLKIEHTCVNTRLEKRLRENNKLENEKMLLKNKVFDLETKLEGIMQENVRNVNYKDQETEALRVQLSKFEENKQNLENVYDDLRQKCDALRQQKIMSEKDSKRVMCEKETELQDLKFSCATKEEALSEVYQRLSTKEKECWNLEQEVSHIQAEKALVADSLGESQDKMSEKLTAVHQTLKNNWEFLQEENYTDTESCEDSYTRLLVSLEKLKHRMDVDALQTQERINWIAEQRNGIFIEKSQLAKEVERLKEEMGGMQDTSESFRLKLETCRDILKKKSNENDVLKKEITQQRMREDVLQQRIKQTEVEYLGALKQIGDMKNSWVCLDESLGVVKFGCDEARENVKKMTEEIINLRNNNEYLKNRNVDLLNELATLQRKTKTNEELLVVYMNNKKKLEQDVCKANDAKEVWEKSIKTLQNEKKNVESKCEDEEKINKLLKLQLKETEKMQLELNKDIERLSNLNKEGNDTNAELQQKLLELQDEKDRLESDLSKLRNRVDRVGIDLDDNTMEKTQLRNQLDDTFTSLERQQEKLSQVLTDKEFLKSQLLDAETEIKSLMNDNSVLNQQVYRSQLNNYQSFDAPEVSEDQFGELRRKDLPKRVVYSDESYTKHQKNWERPNRINASPARKWNNILRR